jgi:hypothetical protein
VDPAGRVLDQPCTHLASDSYAPPAQLARHVIFRDQYCVWPGCRRKAHTCELDHRAPWPDGKTDAANLQPLCKRHHDLKHHSTWRITRTGEGTYDWTSPTRHTYRYRPPEQPVPEPEPPPKIEDDEPPPF